MDQPVSVVTTLQGNYGGKVIPHTNMADDRDPPHLFNNVETEHRDDDDNDDLFSSAIETVNIPFILNKFHGCYSFSCSSSLRESVRL